MSKFNITQHIIPCQHIRQTLNATRDQKDVTLKLAIKQYVPKRKTERASDAVTIIGAHAIGFVKEVYEPLWDDLLDFSEANGFEIRSIWIADTSNQGVSGVLNEQLNGHEPSWNDHSLDLLAMVNHFRDQMPRPIMGFAHSLGCGQLVNLAIIHPRLLYSLVLMEPVILLDPPPGPNVAMMSTLRRDLWPSRPDAEAGHKKNKFFQTWDPRILNKLLHYGLRDVPTAVYPNGGGTTGVPKDAVTLTTTKHQEAWTYLRANFAPQDAAADRLISPDLDDSRQQFYFTQPDSNTAFRNLPFLRPSVLWMFGGKSQMSTADAIEDTSSRTGTGTGGSGGRVRAKVATVVFEDHGHLVPFEKPRDCTRHAAEWFGKQLEQYRADEEFIRSHDLRTAGPDGVTTSDHWKKMVRLPANAVREIRSKI